jgi:hypothetical protein
LRWKLRRGFQREGSFWPTLALLILAAMIFARRLAAVGALEAPLWGDSYHHTMITQLMLDHGGLFSSWEPYVPYRSLTVQFGFPLAAALYAWASGADSAQATLITGQLLNGLAALGLYPLALRVAGDNRWAGVGAVLVAGLLAPMPAYYLNWGRYAQLAGQAILPAALVLLCDALDTRPLSWRKALLAGAMVSGMTLTYYRMPFYYATFVLAWLLCWAVPRWWLSLRAWLQGAACLCVAGAAAVALVLPWALRVANSTLADIAEAGTQVASPLPQVWADYQTWRSLPFFLPWPLTVAALVGLAWALAARRWTAVVAGLWALGLSLIVAGQLVRLPGANLMQNFAVLIALYLPASLLVGWLIGRIAERAPPFIRQGVLAAALVLLGAWGMLAQGVAVDPAAVYVTRPDSRAMAWIDAHTPPSARFLSQGYRIFGGLSAVGADAGWWIPLLARRSNSMPPQYALLTEAPEPPDYSRRVVELADQLEEHSPGTPESLRLLCALGITHAYIGQGQGRVGLGATQLFSAEELAASAAFELVYHRDRVQIFALRPQACRVGS